MWKQIPNCSSAHSGLMACKIRWGGGQSESWGVQYYSTLLSNPEGFWGGFAFFLPPENAWGGGQEIENLKKKQNKRYSFVNRGWSPVTRNIRGKAFSCVLIKYSVTQPGLNRVPVMQERGQQQDGLLMFQVSVLVCDFPDFQIRQTCSWRLCLGVWNIVNIIGAHLLTSGMSETIPRGPFFGWLT